MIGGSVENLKERYGFPHTKSAQSLGKLKGTEETYQYSSVMAQTLRDLGINVNFAPVVDINVNRNNPIIGKRERSFSSEPIVVTQHALAFIEAHHRCGIRCVLKHFPGHGSSSTDSHLGLVDVTDTWSNIELEPYIELIRAGQTDAIMTAHLVNKNLDPTAVPATLSHSIITGLLRDKLNYDGVVFSDDIQMKAIDNFCSSETAIQKTIEAGVDIIVISNNSGTFEENVATKVTALIKHLVMNGTISDNRIDESYRRIRALKDQLM